MHVRKRLRPRGSVRRLRFGQIAALLLITAQAAAAAPTLTPANVPVNAGTPLTVQLDWKTTAQFAGILVARQNGFYAREGLDVTIVPADAEMATVSLVARHPNYIGVTEADVLLVEGAKGYAVKAFATMLQKTPFALLTLKESGLTTIKSLKSKRIGLHSDGQKAIDVLLKFNGMTRDDVAIVDVPYTLDALLNGKVDAMQGYIVDEAVRLSMEHHPTNIIPMSDNGYVSYAEVLFASSAMVEKHPDQLVKFLRATRTGWNYAIAHPDATAQMIVRHYLPGGSVEEQKRSLLSIIPLLNAETGVLSAERGDRFGWMRPETWAQTTAMFNHYQLVDRQVTFDSLVDYSILRKLYGR